MSSWIGIDGRCFHCGEKPDKNDMCLCDRKDEEIIQLSARVAELEAELARIKSNIDITEAATGMCGIYAKLESEIEHQKQLYAAHIGDEHDNCGIKINQKLQAENERLRN